MGEIPPLRHEFVNMLTVAAGASGTLDVTVAPPGKKLRLIRTVIAFPEGTEGKLQIQIRYGDMPVVPDTGYVVGDGEKFVFEKQWLYDAGSPVKIYYNNQDETYSKSCYIAITVEEVE